MSTVIAHTKQSTVFSQCCWGAAMLLTAAAYGGGPRSHSTATASDDHGHEEDHGHEHGPAPTTPATLSPSMVYIKLNGNFSDFFPKEDEHDHSHDENDHGHEHRQTSDGDDDDSHHQRSVTSRSSSNNAAQEEAYAKLNATLRDDLVWALYFEERKCHYENHTNDETESDDGGHDHEHEGETTTPTCAVMAENIRVLSMKEGSLIAETQIDSDSEEERQRINSVVATKSAAGTMTFPGLKALYAEVTGQTATTFTVAEVRATNLESPADYEYDDTDADMMKVMSMCTMAAMHTIIHAVAVFMCSQSCCHNNPDGSSMAHSTYKMVMGLLMAFGAGVYAVFGFAHLGGHSLHVLRDKTGEYTSLRYRGSEMLGVTGVAIMFLFHRVLFVDSPLDRSKLWHDDHDHDHDHDHSASDDNNNNDNKRNNDNIEMVQQAHHHQAQAPPPRPGDNNNTTNLGTMLREAASEENSDMIDLVQGGFHDGSYDGTGTRSSHQPQPQPPAPHQSNANANANAHHDDDYDGVVTAPSRENSDTVAVAAHQEQRSQIASLVSLIALFAIRGLFEGMTIGLQQTKNNVLIAWFAVIVHRWTSTDVRFSVEGTGGFGLGFSSPLFHQTKVVRFLIAVVTAVVSLVLGIGIGWGVQKGVDEIGGWTVGVLYALLAGTFSFHALTDIIPTVAPAGQRSWQHLIAFIVGTGAMYGLVVGLYAEDDHLSIFSSSH